MIEEILLKIIRNVDMKEKIEYKQKLKMICSDYFFCLIVCLLLLPIDIHLSILSILIYLLLLSVSIFGFILSLIMVKKLSNDIDNCIK